MHRIKLGDAGEDVPVGELDHEKKEDELTSEKFDYVVKEVKHGVEDLDEFL